MSKLSEGLLKWRSKQKRGAIMEPETFQKIKKKGAKKTGSAERGEKIAGAAYWKTAKEKYAKRKKNA